MYHCLCCQHLLCVIPQTLEAELFLEEDEEEESKNVEDIRPLKACQMSCLLVQ